MVEPGKGMGRSAGSRKVWVCVACGMAYLYPLDFCTLCMHKCLERVV
jgi:hypothetical protein